MSIDNHHRWQRSAIKKRGFQLFVVLSIVNSSRSDAMPDWSAR